ncbi:MAG: hypothetical protein GQ558_04190, partial [Thermoplasmata archaeon]|nr:hypothetical protein [Thermoplasmata archaeon]
MTGTDPLSPRRYVMRQLRSRPARSGLIVAGIAIAVAFFVLFGSMSAGLSGFIEEELAQERPVNLYLVSGSPTPFGTDDVFLISVIGLQSQGTTGVPHHTTTRAQLGVSSTASDRPLWLWGIDDGPNGTFFTPPYDPSAPLEWGRHL